MIVRIYTGDDGETHFADVDIPAGGDPVSMALKDGADIRFTHTGEKQVQRLAQCPAAPIRHNPVRRDGGRHRRWDGAQLWAWGRSAGGRPDGPGPHHQDDSPPPGRGCAPT